MKDFIKPVYEKTDEDTQKIMKFLKNKDKINLQVLFGHLSDSALSDVVAAMYDRQIRQGENIISQGEQGDAFYVVETGQYDIYVARKDGNGLGTPKKVLEVGPGSSFGELALMYVQRSTSSHYPLHVRNLSRLGFGQATFPDAPNYS